MVQAPLERNVLIDTVRAVSTYGGVSAAAKAIGVKRPTLQHRYQRAVSSGIMPGSALKSSGKETLDESILAELRRLPKSASAIAESVGASEKAVTKALRGLHEKGHNIHEASGLYSIAKEPAPAPEIGAANPYKSRRDGTYLFGACGDSHLGSRYERLDVLNELYDEFAAVGVDRVFHTGNWVDGECRFNLHDLHTHGMQQQIEYLVEKYPVRDGITTYAVWGDDHEGWWAKREGVDVGRMAEHSFRDAGRTDWVNLGFMESYVPAIHSQTGVEAQILVAHPGGGSAYALSYSIQKILESLSGGEKPAIGLWGHYHKLWSGNIRNVWSAQTGTTCDQTPFMRKKRLEAHVGGMIIRAHQDSRTGAITRFVVDTMRWFNRGYYNGRWNPAGDVTKAELSLGYE